MGGNVAGRGARRRTNLALIGFMGTGKSTVGRLVAKRLGMDFLETDALVEREAGKTIPRIFSEDGEAAFRAFEERACRLAARREGTVISCGGGVVLNPVNLEALRTSSILVLLEATPREILERTLGEGKEKRPLLDVDDPLRAVEDLLEYRRPFYEAATPHRVDTTGLDPHACVEQVIAAFKRALSETGAPC
ncbi:MAG: shikimate kinase [Promethearchaeota archaeon]